MSDSARGRDGAPHSAGDAMRAEDRSRIGYFVLQTRTAVVDALLVRAVLEDLRTGEKWTFGSSSELSRFLDRLGMDTTRDDPPPPTEARGDGR
ncbi:MAG: hypothetical protein ABI601_05595 [bacterium]